MSARIRNARISARIRCFIYIIFGNVDQFYSDETHVGKLLRRPVI